MEKEEEEEEEVEEVEEEEVWYRSSLNPLSLLSFLLCSLPPSFLPTILSVLLHSACPKGSKKTKMRSALSPSQESVRSTSKGYFMSPSTKPGVSMNVTNANFFCLEVAISVLR